MTWHGDSNSSLSAFSACADASYLLGQQEPTLYPLTDAEATLITAATATGDVDLSPAAMDGSLNESKVRVEALDVDLRPADLNPSACLFFAVWLCASIGGL